MQRCNSFQWQAHLAFKLNQMQLQERQKQLLKSSAYSIGLWNTIHNNVKIQDRQEFEMKCFPNP